jgi:hypothetical protein
LPGVYKGTFAVTVGGQEGKPIIWRAAKLGDGRKLDENGNPEEVVLDPNGKTAIALAADCVTFDGLTIRNAATGMEGNGRGDITVRFCRFVVSQQGIKAQHPREHAVENFYIADNFIEGPRSWPREAMDGTGGIDLSGSGHVVCRNRIRGFSDGFSICRAPKTFAIDVYENDICDCIDDGIETDYSDYNVRIYRNRLTNVYQAISGQPIRGGPVYIFRNIIYNVAGHAEIFKLHNYTSGLLFVHNTSVKKGTALHCGTPEPARNVNFFNNLFVGAGEGKGLAVNFGQTMINSQFDYNGVVGEGFSGYIRWSKGDWLSENQVKESGPVQRNGLLVKGKGSDLFATSLQVPEDDKTGYPPKMNDPQLKEDAAVIDKGLVMPGFNEDFKGKAPDFGAHEFGTDLPQFGPRLDPDLEAKEVEKKVE